MLARKTIFAAALLAFLPALHADGQPLGGFGQGTPAAVALGPWVMGYGTSNSVSVAASSGTLFLQGAFQAMVQYCTLPSSTANVYLNPTGAAAVVHAGLPIAAGGPPNGCIRFGAGGLPFPNATTTAISDSGTATLTQAGY